MYRIKAQGYGGGGPSVPTTDSDDINVIREQMEDLIDSDHAVQLYKVDADGVETRISFEYYTTTTVAIGE
jgi:hypothetical protein